MVETFPFNMIKNKCVVVSNNIKNKWISSHFIKQTESDYVIILLVTFLRI
jgi:hypothetical protein